MVLSRQLYSFTNSLPLAIYRIAFGLLSCFSLLRFIAKGWVEDCYLQPKFHFTYHYFEWIQPLNSTTAMYALVIFSAIAALFIAIGFLYRIATVVFFLSFTYLELIEQSWYLNHYYFVSIIAFLLCFIPAHNNYSIDAILIKGVRKTKIANWGPFILKIQISIVYFLAGIAKLKSDWLLDAMPLKLWLKAKTELPIIGSLFQYEITPYLFSYGGLIYDLSIPFLLWNKKTRPYAFATIVIFHVLTAALFNIGMFPWIMIAGSLIFISSEISEVTKNLSSKLKKGTVILMGVFFAFQIIIPLRHLFYNENLLWTERNFRFSWNVMLMEKNGSAVFTVKDKTTGKTWTEYPKEHLTVIQEKQMSFQPDMIWQYAQFLEEEYIEKGYKNVSVSVNSYVTLNGRPSQQYLPKDLELNTIDRNSIYEYVLPLK